MERSGFSAGELEIDAVELERNIRDLGNIGRDRSGRLYRPVYTKAWSDALDLLEAWLRALDFECRRDAVGNLFGRIPGRGGGKTVLTGSHIDTVKNGGSYDGALGIHTALFAADALRRAAGPPRADLEVVALCEEEGSRFNSSLWGSRAITGTIQEHEADALVDEAGVTLADAMRGVGLDPSAIGSAQRTDIAAFVELHIEQGRILDDEEYDVGVVDSITGLRQILVTVGGRTDHAGTTPMDLRRDALRGGARMIDRIAEIAEQFGRPAVATVGRAEPLPGATNVVPGEFRFTVDARHPDPAARDRLNREVDAMIHSVSTEFGLSATIEVLIDHPPVALDEGVRTLIRQAARDEELRHLTMPSGAGHDSMIMAQHWPTGMVFVPSRDGRSHSPVEFTPIEQVIPGVRVLARALHALAY